LFTNILITGGRAPVALELSRLFAERGCRVFIADSTPHPIARASNSVIRTFLVPPPRQNPEGYIAELERIVAQENISLIIPTCEEIYTLARYKNRLPIFCDTFEKLAILHNKGDFIKLAKSMGLPVPKTLHIPSDMVLKPVYSRFASKIHILREPVQWVMQELLNGKAYCTYTIAFEGEMRAHVTYPVNQRAGQGACLTFEAIEEPRILDWITKFVKEFNFTGQIAFDFIEGDDGYPYPIECNPRATSGAHLFSAELVDAFFKPVTVAPITTKKMIALGLLCYAWRDLKGFWESKDVIFSWKDPKPFFYQFISFFSLWRIAKRIKKPILEASTHDIEWNGEL
jgi:predicted ATP-grasp superfamily ATP-dependent carboligase